MINFGYYAICMGFVQISAVSGFLPFSSLEKGLGDEVFSPNAP